MWRTRVGGLHSAPITSMFRKRCSMSSDCACRLLSARICLATALDAPSRSLLREPPMAEGDAEAVVAGLLRQCEWPPLGDPPRAEAMPSSLRSLLPIPPPAAAAEGDTRRVPVSLVAAGEAGAGDEAAASYSVVVSAADVGCQLEEAVVASASCLLFVGATACRLSAARDESCAAGGGGGGRGDSMAPPPSCDAIV